MMPEELSRMIQDFARPRTNPQWRKGSYIYQQSYFGEFYWEMFEGPWYEFEHKEDIMISYFIFGMNSLPIAYMLRTLFYYRGDELVQLILKELNLCSYLMNNLREEMRECDRNTKWIKIYYRNNMSHEYV